jgi:hypothetical protein
MYPGTGNLIQLTQGFKWLCDSRICVLGQKNLLRDTLIQGSAELFGAHHELEFCQIKSMPAFRDHTIIQLIHTVTYYTHELRIVNKNLKKNSMFFPK